MEVRYWLASLSDMTDVPAAISAFCDFALALFPFTFIRKLHIEVHKRIVLGLLMSCGVV